MDRAWRARGLTGSRPTVRRSPFRIPKLRSTRDRFAYLPQISAARAALRKVEDEVLRDHVAHCVEHAIASGDAEDQRRKISELMEVFARAEH